MKIAEIEQNVKQVILKQDNDRFIYDLLLAYGKPKASVKRLEDAGVGSYNLSKQDGVILWKKQVLFAKTTSSSLDVIVERHLDSEAVEKHAPRFIIATNFERLFAVDTKTEDELDVAIAELQQNFDFFLPWAGMEKAQVVVENPADVKAAEKMAKLFDIIKADNSTDDPAALHALNVFLSRLLFCYFAEDTGIFPTSLFSTSIESHTSKDGGDLQAYLAQLFEALNTADRDRFPGYLRQFPYVNGGLFAETITIPRFTAKSRAVLIECGLDLNWAEINPDIFGSMIQAVVDVKKRSSMGMHYTSVSNIMKVMEPLFLNELKAEFERCKDSQKKLVELQQRIAKLKVFDPACGSGNFLIIAYKELRKLEMEIFEQISALNKQDSFAMSDLRLGQFYGIELDDFAHEVAILALWLAEHQMNIAFHARFGKFPPTLPLKPSGNIHAGNATAMDWNDICSKSPGDEIYLLGNPPYFGSKKQNKDQKADIASVFKHTRTYKNLDYIACWLMKAARYIRGHNVRAGFVTTNSLVQGDQVGLLWPSIFDQKVAINYAYKPFKWGNNAKNKAGVTCVIIGLANEDVKDRWIYHDTAREQVKNISPYLTNTGNVIVFKRNQVLSGLPEMLVGNMSLDSGYLKLEPAERASLLAQSPEAAKFVRPLTGGNEFLYGEERYCIWIEDDDLDEALAIPELNRRIDGVRKGREEGGDVARTLLRRCHQFRYRRVAQKGMLLIPCTSSEKREYLQVGFFGPGAISLHSAQVIYNDDPLLFGVVSSRLHMLWTKATCGTLDNRVRYSNVLSYNNFPFPRVNDAQKTQIRQLALAVVAAREQFSEMTVAEMYDPKLMPAPLKSAHVALDAAIEACFQKDPFASDDERLTCLFKAYAKLTGE